MKNGFFIFLAAFIALGGSWLGFVYGPVHQLGGAGQTTVLNSTDTYPLQRPGDARARARRFIAPTAVPPATRNRSGRPASRATWC